MEFVFSVDNKPKKHACNEVEQHTSKQNENRRFYRRTYAKAVTLTVAKYAHWIDMIMKCVYTVHCRWLCHCCWLPMLSAHLNFQAKQQEKYAILSRLVSICDIKYVQLIHVRKIIAFKCRLVWKCAHGMWCLAATLIRHLVQFKFSSIMESKRLHQLFLNLNLL